MRALPVLLTALLTGCNNVPSHWDRMMDDACDNVDTGDVFDQASHDRQGCDEDE